mgnify:CR=1 FL=1|jgi:hypothetical protein
MKNEIFAQAKALAKLGEIELSTPTEIFDKVHSWEEIKLFIIENIQNGFKRKSFKFLNENTIYHEFSLNLFEEIPQELFDEICNEYKEIGWGEAFITKSEKRFQGKYHFTITFSKEKFE